MIDLLVEWAMWAADWAVSHWIITILWVLCNIGPAWYTIYSNRKVAYNRERDSVPSARPFCRHDYHKWSYLLVIFTHFFFFPRWIMGWVVFTSGSALTKILTIGHKKGDPYPEWKLRFLREYYRWDAWGVGLIVGYIWTGFRRHEADYKKWLGPDWKPKYEGAGISLMNHSSPFDTIMMQSILPYHSVMGK